MVERSASRSSRSCSRSPSSLASLYPPLQRYHHLSIPTQSITTGRSPLRLLHSITPRWKPSRELNPISIPVIPPISILVSAHHLNQRGYLSHILSKAM